MSAIAIILLIIVGVAAFYIGQSTTSSETGSTLTVTSTVGSGGTVTKTATVTNTATVTSTISADLIQQAKAEGSVTIYGLVDTSDVQAVIGPAFNQAFPGVTVNYLGLGNSQIVAKVQLEHQAGHSVADAVILDPGDIITLYKQGAMMNWTNPMMEVMNYPPTSGAFAVPGVSSASADYPLVWAYNTNLVSSASQLPSTVWGFSASQWQGKFGMLQVKPPLPNGMFSYATLAQSNGLTDAQFTSNLQALAANNPVFPGTASDAYTFLTSGQMAFAEIGEGDLVSGLSGSSPAPIALDTQIPGMNIPTPLALVTNSPHPYAAQLFAEWLASYPGQEALAQTGRQPQYPPLATEFIAKALAGVHVTLPPGYQFLSIYNSYTFAHQTQLNSTFTQIFG